MSSNFLLFLYYFFLFYGSLSNFGVKKRMLVPLGVLFNRKFSLRKWQRPVAFPLIPDGSTFAFDLGERRRSYLPVLLQQVGSVRILSLNASPLLGACFPFMEGGRLFFAFFLETGSPPFHSAEMNTRASCFLSFLGL